MNCYLSVAAIKVSFKNDDAYGFTHVYLIQVVHLGNFDWIVLMDGL